MFDIQLCGYSITDCLDLITDLQITDKGFNKSVRICGIRDHLQNYADCPLMQAIEKSAFHQRNQ